MADCLALVRLALSTRPGSPCRRQARSRFGASLLAIAVAFVASASRIARAAGPVTLAGKAWTVAIDPGTLAVSAEAADAPGERMAVAAARPVAGVVADLARDGDRAVRWAYPAEKVAVAARLTDADVLSVQITGTDPGTFAWPTVPGGSAKPDDSAKPGGGAVDLLVLPMFEGLCVPTADADWATFLADHGPLNTTGDLSMPFWGTLGRRHGLTYVLTNPYNNEVAFAAKDGRLGLTLTHAFPPNGASRTYGVEVHLTDASPVSAAKVYRAKLVAEGRLVTLKQKAAKVPDVAKLAGAAHVYLWGDDPISRHDVRDFKRLAAALRSAGEAKTPSPAGRAWSLLDAASRERLAGLPAKEFVDPYERREVAAVLSQVLARRDFYDAATWTGVQPPADAAVLLEKGIDALSAGEVVRLNSNLLAAALPDALAPADTWGDGCSTKMVQALADAKLDRLWLGSPSWAGLANRPAFVERAKALGYLVGPYDSYHSIHAPGQADTWETAQFDAALFARGGVVRVDGQVKKGFLQRGKILSPLAARPYLEARVDRLMNAFRCNSWFVDCDATGEVFDDYAPAHPGTQADDEAERVRRLAWIAEKYQAVVGSEGGSAYAAPAIHFAHGMMTPVIGWGDVAMAKDKQSPFYLGAYYPPDGPSVFFKQVPLKPQYAKVYADPRYRLPLYETVFHDSVVATHQWGYGSLKFADPHRTRELLELLYAVPPLYHLNLAEWAARKTAIVEHFQFFSPLHRATFETPMTDFRWLTPDRLVQRSTFGDEVELTANFGDEPYQAGQRDGQGTIPPHAIAVRWKRTGAVQVYPPTGGGR